MLQHNHVIVRAEVLNPPTYESVINSWLTNLVSDLGMKIMMGPFSGYSPVVGNRGLTAGVIIETSHIVMHCWDEDNPAMMQLDVYTCSKLDLDVVWKAMQIFQPVHIDYKLLNREDKFLRLVENNS